MSEMNPLVQNPSKDPRELLKAALPLARSTRPADQAALLGGLGSESYLGRLDSTEDRIKLPAQQLRVARIFKLLLMNESEASRNTLVSLTQAATFRASDPHEELLVKCLAVVRPAPDQAIRYWDAHSTPDHVHLHFTIDALCNNGSEPAIALLERKMADPDQDPDFKLAWMRDGILRHRNDVPLLQGCERMATGGIAGEFRPHLVDALCDYRRDEWYRSCKPPVAPSRALASQEAKDVLLRICRHAKDKLELTPVQALGVERTFKELGGEEDEKGNGRGPGA